MTVTASEFLSTIFEDVPDGEVVLIAKQRGKGFAHVAHPSRTFDTWLSRGKSALYFNIATVAVPDSTDEPLRRRSEDCGAVYCMVLDDIGSKVDNPPVEPSWILETSPGSFQWGYIIEPTEELTRFAALMDAVADAGYTDKGAKGFNRLMRIPGSINTKPGRQNFEAALTLWNPDRTFGSINDIAQTFGVEIGVVKPRERKTKTSAMAALELEVEDPVAEWLMDNDYVVDDDGEWLSIECPNGDAHSTGDTTARYSPLGRGHGDWQMHRGFKCFHEHCKDVDLLKWVSEQGGPEARTYDPMPFLRQRYTYVMDGRRICDMHSLARGGLYDSTLEEFGDLYAYMKVHLPTAKDKKRYVSARVAFMEDRETIRARRYDVVPHTIEERDYNGLTLDEANEVVVNTYQPPSHADAPSQEALSMFLTHVNYLLPDNNDSTLFLDWLAYKLQRPRSRSYGIVMVAEDTFGIGRSWLGDVIRSVWTGRNVQSVDIGDLTGHGPSAGYNDWASGSQLVIIEEAHDGGTQTQYKAYERIKTLVDPRVTKMQVNTKFGAKRQENIWFNLLVFSNHGDAFTLPKSERRLAVYANPSQTHPESYYANLWELYDKRRNVLAASIYDFLIKRDVSAFKHAVPPMTDAKRAMIERSSSPADIIVDALRTHAIGELTTRHMLFDLWEEAERTEHLENTLTNSVQRRFIEKLWSDLPKLGNGRNGYRTRALGGAQEEVRALRRGDYWVTAVQKLSADEVKQELSKTGKGMGRKQWTIEGAEVL